MTLYRKASKAQVLAEYGIEIATKDTDVIDFWDAERNSVLVNEVFAKNPTPHNIGHVPVLIGHVGSMPTLQSGDFDTTVQYQGDSVWGASGKLYEPQNRYISSLMDIHERSIVGSLVHWSRDGAKQLKGDPYRSYQEIQLEYDVEDLKPLVLPEPPPVTSALLGLIEADIQQSTLPYPLAYGGTQQAMSGRALSVLSDATRSVYEPRTAALADAYTWLCEELLVQFVKKGNKAVTLRGFRPDVRKEKQFFGVTVGPDKIDSDWFVRVKVEPRMPRDEEAEIGMALAATQKRGPEDIQLLSKQTARETILQLQDPDAEEDKVLAEMGKALPPIIAANVAAALKRRGEDELAEQVMLLLRPPQQRQTPQLPPELIEAIVAVLVKVGAKDLASAFVQALGGAEVGSAPGHGGAGLEVPPEQSATVGSMPMRPVGAESMAQPMDGGTPITP